MVDNDDTAENDDDYAEDEEHEEDTDENDKPWYYPPPNTLNDFCAPKHLSQSSRVVSYRQV